MFNDKFNVYRSEWLDLVFANRNHEYGAYELRKNYSKTLNKALLTASVLFVSAVSFPVVYKNLSGNTPPATPSLDLPINKTAVLDLSRMKIQPPAPAPAPKPEAVKIKTTRFVPLRVVEASRVKEEMPDIKTLSSTVISTKNQEGAQIPSDVSPVETGPGAGNGTGVAESSAGNEPVDFASVEKFPEFPGGMEAFSKFLRKNLRYPSAAVESGVTGRVFVSFIVEKDGSLTGIKVIKGIGFGCDEEAVRVLRKSPLWLPGIQNKQKVRVQYTLPLLFQMQ